MSVNPLSARVVHPHAPCSPPCTTTAISSAPRSSARAPHISEDDEPILVARQVSFGRLSADIYSQRLAQGGLRARAPLERAGMAMARSPCADMCVLRGSNIVPEGSVYRALPNLLGSGATLADIVSNTDLLCFGKRWHQIGHNFVELGRSSSLSSDMATVQQRQRYRSGISVPAAWQRRVEQIPSLLRRDVGRYPRRVSRLCDPRDLVGPNGHRIGSRVKLSGCLCIQVLSARLGGSRGNIG